MSKGILMYALEDLQAGNTVPNAGNPLAPSQKAIYGNKVDADNVAYIGNTHNPGRFKVVIVNIVPAPVDTAQ